MKPVMQEIWRDTEATRGDCLAACVASVLERDLADVPHFVASHGGQWFKPLRTWLNDQGYDALYFSLRNRGDSWTPRGTWIATVQRTTRNRKHAVVMRGTEMAHDPNPDPALAGRYTFGRCAALVIFPLSP